MTPRGFTTEPRHRSYDVVIVGGAIMGSSTAWWLTELGFPGRVLVVERDPSYAACSTAHTNSCIRQQFSDPLNIRLSQFTADFIRDFRAKLGGDERIPPIDLQSFGYLYLADNDGFAEALRAAAAVQHQCGTPTELLTAPEIAVRYPFYEVGDIVLGSINTRDEGYWDGGSVFEWFRRKAMEREVEYLAGEVTGLTREGGRITQVALASGQSVGCGTLVNAPGPRAARTAAMAGLDLPVEPRRRFTWVFKSERPLGGVLPLTIDPTGVHMRQDGPESFVVGCTPDPDPAVEPEDFSFDHALWEDRVWPVLATRIPAFERLRVINHWTGHYAYNTLDQNAIVGPHPEVGNFLFLNGFSGHGLQQSPGMGRGIAELLTFGEYRSLDLGPFSITRILENRPMTEKAII